MLLTLLSLSSLAMGANRDFGRSSVAAKTLLHGFPNAGEFDDFGSSLNRGLKGAGKIVRGQAPCNYKNSWGEEVGGVDRGLAAISLIPWGKVAGIGLKGGVTAVKEGAEAVESAGLFKRFFNWLSGTGASDEIAGTGIDAAKGGMTLVDEMAVLRQATTGEGNFGVGSASSADAMRLGNAWVGNGSRVASDGRTLVSADGLRTFRPPSAKPNSPYATTGVQANFESLERVMINGVEKLKVIRNGHLDITP